MSALALTLVLAAAFLHATSNYLLKRSGGGVGFVWLFALSSTLIYAPLAIGLALTLIHLVSIPVTNTSVNPARSTGVAVFVGGWAIEQLWLFWVAPIIGAVLAALAYKPLSK